MDRRALILDASALSPPEYKAFGGYLAALTHRSSITPSSVQQDASFSRADLKQLGASAIGCEGSQLTEILSAIQPDASQALSLGQTFAYFRLANHARIAKLDQKGERRKTDINLVFVPCAPVTSETARAKAPPPVPSRKGRPSSGLGKGLPSTIVEPSAAASNIRGPSSSQPPNRSVSGPSSVTFASTAQASSSSPVVTDFALTNPFRARMTSGPLLVARPPPSLPPRKVSQGEGAGDVARSKRRTPSIASVSSTASYQTSGTRASALIHQSLLAAEHQSSLTKKSEPQLSIIRQSGSIQPAPSDATRIKHSNAELQRRVSTAVRRSEQDPPAAPPRRTASVKSKSRISSLVQPHLTVHPATTPWSCVDLVQGLPGPRSYAMIILNQPITRKDIFLRAWTASELRLCADGGANRLYDLLDPEQRAQYTPTLIKGDLDSLRPDVREYYAKRGVTIKQDGDEYSTDLQKCIQEIEKVEKEKGVQYDLLLMGGLSGRVDQTVHVMSLLHKLRKTRPKSFILSSESLAWVLDAGKHVIEIDHTTMGQTCGILPVGVDKAYVKTEGLKWNLDCETSFDGEVSSSNHLLPSEPLVHLTTNKPVMWCIEIKPDLPTLPAAKSQRRQSVRFERHPDRPDHIPQKINDLSAGMAKAAKGLSREV